MKECAVVLLPFLGTTLGAAMVFLMKGEINARLEKMLLGFAAGVMLAASVWSLLIPAIELSEERGGVAWWPAGSGFLLGMGVFLLLDGVVPQLHSGRGKREGDKESSGKRVMLALAVTLHNVPEGMAVGVTLAGVMLGNTGITIISAMLLSIGIAIQNFPEGAIISMPLRGAGTSRAKAFCYGVLSGIVEPVGAVVTYVLAESVIYILPYLLAFAAGAMIYVVVAELVPEAQSGERANAGTIGVTLGFVLMMVLDVALA